MIFFFANYYEIFSSNILGKHYYLLLPLYARVQLASIITINYIIESQVMTLF